MANLDVKRKGDITIYHYNFNSLDDFLNELITKKINTRIFPHPESIYGDYNFTRTNSFEEAWNLCKFTYDGGYQDFSNMVKKIQFKFENTEKIINTYKPVGSSVNISRFLSGIPNNMRAKEKVYNNPVINIYYQFSYSCSTLEGQIKNRGILTLALVNYLENIKKYKVILNFESIVRKDNEIIIITIKLKNETEKLKIKKCYFPIVHPSFERRLSFRVEEIIPNLRANWSLGYGRPLNYQEINEFLNRQFDKKNTIFISSPLELEIEGNSIFDDADKFIDNINSKYTNLDDDNAKKYFRKK